MRDARIELTWADGDYSFRLGWGQLSELQDRVNCGPFFLLNRLKTGEWRVEDISNIVRLGLIGGGMSPVTALNLTRKYVEERPPLENHEIACIILQAGLIGSPEEPVGEQVAANQKDESSTTSPTEKSDLPPSTEPELRSVTRRRKSTK